VANVSFSINAVDKTRAAFASVERGLQRLDERGKAFRRTAGSAGTALATALGLSMQSIAEKIAEFGAEKLTGISKEDLDNLNRANAMRDEAMDIAERRRVDAMSDEQRLADLLRQEERTRARIATIGNDTYADQRRLREEELQLQRILAEREALQRSLAPDMGKLKEEAEAAQTAAGKAMSKMLGPTLTASERVEALNGRLSRLQYELARIDEQSPEGLQRRTQILQDMTHTAEGLADAMVDVNEELRESQRWADEVGGRMSASFENAVFSGGKLRDMLRSIANDLLRLVFQQTITAPLANWMSTGLKTMFGGPRAVGGPVAAGTPYLVGENGAEVFTPSTAGRIIPNHAMAGSAGGAAVINQSFSFSSGLQAAQILPMLEQTKQATIAAIVDLRARRKIA
jgi:chromosome segregation ATPase